jgi:NSS family neurotransmitter:Na+ symporter
MKTPECNVSPYLENQGFNICFTNTFLAIISNLWLDNVINFPTSIESMIKGIWHSKKAFILASIGAAVGIGNIWRFPYIASENGGIWFLIPYFICLILVGIPLFMMESGQGALSKLEFFRAVQKSRNLPFIKNILRAGLGAFPIIVITVITGYYIAITSWILWFAFQFLMGNAPTFGEITQGYSQLIPFFLVFIGAIYIAMKNIHKGIEPATRILVPCFFFLLLALLIYALSLPNSLNYVQHEFNGGYEKIFESKTWYFALSQVLFSLSVGYGIIFTYGTHLKNGKIIYPSTFKVVLADTSASLIAFFTIAILSGVLGVHTTGLGLSFDILPPFFESQGTFGLIVGVIFFVLLFSAAFSSLIAMLNHINTSTSFLPVSKRALIAAGILTIGLIAILSYSPMKLDILGKPALDQLDFFFGTFLAPFCAIAMIICCAYLMPHESISELVGVPLRYQRFFVLLIQKIIPGLLILLIIFSQISGLY